MNMHTLTVEITTYLGSTSGRPFISSLTQFIDSDEFDPENRTVGILASNAFDMLVRDTDLGDILRGFGEESTEDCRICISFDGEYVADEAAAYVGSDYMNDYWVGKHPEMARA